MLNKHSALLHDKASTFGRKAIDTCLAGRSLDADAQFRVVFGDMLEEGVLGAEAFGGSSGLGQATPLAGKSAVIAHVHLDRRNQGSTFTFNLIPLIIQGIVDISGLLWLAFLDMLAELYGVDDLLAAIRTGVIFFGLFFLRRRLLFLTIVFQILQGLLGTGLLARHCLKLCKRWYSDSATSFAQLGKFDVRKTASKIKRLVTGIEPNFLQFPESTKSSFFEPLS